MKFLFLLSVALSLGLYRASPQKKIEEVVLKIDFCKNGDHYDYCYSTIYSNNFKDTNYYSPAGHIYIYIMYDTYLGLDNELAKYKPLLNDTKSSHYTYAFFKSFFSSKRNLEDTTTIQNPIKGENYLFRSSADKVSLIVCVKGETLLFEEELIYGYKDHINDWGYCSEMERPEQMQECLKTITTAKKIYPPSPRIIKKLGLAKFEQDSFMTKNCYYHFYWI